MSEYLSPGVYVEETSFRSKMIEGVSTSTFGMVGQSLTGPTGGRPEVLTSFGEFERTYGGLEDLPSGSPNYSALAARAFFNNGGKRLYFARVIASDAKAASLGDVALATVRARYKGKNGNLLRVQFTVKSDQDSNISDGVSIRGVYRGAIVTESPVKDPTAAVTWYTVDVKNGKFGVKDKDGAWQAKIPPKLYLLEVNANIFYGDSSVPTYSYAGLSTGRDAARFVGTFFGDEQPGGSEVPVTVTVVEFNPIKLLAGLVKMSDVLNGGNDGGKVDSSAYVGSDDFFTPSGFNALAQIDDIAIIAAPDAVNFDEVEHTSVNNAAIQHCEMLKYRFAILDMPKGARQSPMRSFRAKYDTKYAALYAPWVKIADPRLGGSGRLLLVPPSGSVAGIYARTDIDRGVWKAPANVPVADAQDFEFRINKGVQDVLNPEGINCLRYFDQNGFRVWGARTLSRDPEWKYINVRRLFIFLEHSIDRGTQWTVFEPNNERTWANVRNTVWDFMFNVWTQGALMGNKPEEGFFVKCDRTTMTQNDLDNGRLVCLIGVAPAYPAEFVIFRIGQWTADAKRS